MLTPYPNDITEPATIVLSKLRGTDVPVTTLAHAAYQLQGVAMGNLLPDGAVAPVGGKCRVGSCSTEECCTALEEVITAAKKEGFQAGLITLNWRAILSAALAILQQILGS